jgi:hypothetical protein
VNRERRRTSCSGNDPQEGVRSRQRVSGSWVGLVVSAGSAEGSVDSSVNGKIAFGRFDAANGGNPHSRSTRTARARPRCRSPGQEPLLGARRHTARDRARGLRLPEKSPRRRRRSAAPVTNETSGRPETSVDLHRFGAAVVPSNQLIEQRPAPPRSRPPEGGPLVVLGARGARSDVKRSRDRR